MQRGTSFLQSDFSLSYTTLQKIPNSEFSDPFQVNIVSGIVILSDEKIYSFYSDDDKYAHDWAGRPLYLVRGSR